MFDFGEIWKLRRLPLRIAIQKIANRILCKRNNKKREKILEEIIFSKIPEWFTDIETGYFAIQDTSFLGENKDKIRKIAKHIIEHNFNLLGTGWVSWNSKFSSKEIIDRLPDFWQPFAKIIIEDLEQKNYKILDFWSNPVTSYTWLPKFYKEIRIAIGNDIKYPWELGRMQYLPILVYAFRLFQETEPEFAESCLNEFENQVLNFIATNPVGYTVQWRSSMDVGIRLVNWLVSYDLFCSCNIVFDSSFKTLFLESIYKHILFLLNNLEWSEGLRGNHYFANISALVFSGAYLPQSSFTSQILAFSLQELIQETLYQFFPDGGNFECSTYYHFQTAEMLFFSLLLLLSLNKKKVESLLDYEINRWNFSRKLKKSSSQKFQIDKENLQIIFPDEFQNLVRKIVQFSYALRKPNEEIEQIGDTDSGYFLRLNFFFDSFEHYNECYDNVLKRQHFFHLVNLVSGNDFESGRSRIFFAKTNYSRLSLPKEKIYVLPKILYYQNFGLCIAKSSYYYFTFRCGYIGQNGKGGHSHNDQLSFTLFVFGKDFVVDSGTFCYTCSEEERNKFRSVLMHNTIVWNKTEQNLWKTTNPDDLFWIYKHRTNSRLVLHDEKKIIAEHFAYGKPCRRQILFELNRFEFVEQLELYGEKLITINLYPSVEASINSNFVYLRNNNVEICIIFPDSNIEIKDSYYSPQYGLKIPNKKIIYSSFSTEIKWQILLESQPLKI